MKNLTIKQWSLDDRPREKLLNKGKHVLSDAELIAILIGSGNRQESAVDLSKRILNAIGKNLNELAKLSVKQLTQFNGIGQAKAISIITALELGRRRQLENALKKPNVASSKDVFEIMQPTIADLPHEEFWALFLSNSNKVLAKNQISKGGITATVVDVRLLFKKAIELSSVGIVICHNHPSGKLNPSFSDKEITKKIKQAGTTLDIKLLDHIIIAEKTYFSFADQGIL